jgi:ATP-dependent Clp protease ATP-binding subunit ClpA
VAVGKRHDRRHPSPAGRTDHVNIEIQQAERNYDLNRAAELKYGKLTDCSASSKPPKTKLEECPNHRRSLLREEVTEEDIAEIISKWTGIPVSKLVAVRNGEAAAPGGRAAPAGDRSG